MLNKKLTLASYISLSRILIFFVFILCDYFGVNRIVDIALLIYIIFSDWLDGFIARKLNQISELGKILDPVADKVVFSLGALYFYWKYNFSIWIFLILFIRDFLILAFSYYFKEKFEDIPVSNIWGKISTTFLGLAFFIFYIGYKQYIIFLIIGLFFLFFSSLIYLRDIISKIEKSILVYIDIFNSIILLWIILFIIDMFVFEINKYILLIIVLFLFLVFSIFLLFQFAFSKKQCSELKQKYEKESFILNLSKVSFHNIGNILTSFSLKLNILESNIKSCQEIKNVKFIFNKIKELDVVDEDEKLKIVTLVDRTLRILNELYNKIGLDLSFLDKKLGQISNQLLQYQYIYSNLQKKSKFNLSLIVEDILNIFKNSFYNRDINIDIKHIDEISFRSGNLDLYNVIFYLFGFLKSFFDFINIRIDGMKELELSIYKKEDFILFTIDYKFDKQYYDFISSCINKRDKVSDFVKLNETIKKLNGTFDVLEDFNVLRIMLKIPEKIK